MAGPLPPAEASGFLRTRMTESPLRNIFGMYRSLFTGFDFFLPERNELELRFPVASPKQIIMLPRNGCVQSSSYSVTSKLRHLCYKVLKFTTWVTSLMVK